MSFYRTANEIWLDSTEPEVQRLIDSRFIDLPTYIPSTRTGREYVRTAIGYLDTLGAKNESKSPAFMNALCCVAALDKARCLLDDSSTHPEILSRWFSDNLALTTRLDPSNSEETNAASLATLIQRLASIHTYLLLEYGIASRGAVVVGACHHDENLIFGPALVAAVELEWAADTPRIVISRECSAMLQVTRTPIPCFAPEPLRLKNGGADTADAIDFLDLEVARMPNSKELFLSLERIVELGLVSADAGDRYRWKWLRDRIAEAINKN